MSRSLWKGPYFRCTVPNVGLNKIYISRASTILPTHIGKTFDIHNGKRNIKVMILAEMVGHKFGEFAPTKLK